MVTITRQGDDYHFEVEGWHKLWSLKSQLRIPIENVLRAYQNPEELKGFKGIRAPGTHIPSLITAGTYYPLEGGKIFWDVVNQENAIIIELQDDNYKKLIVEVADPAEAIALFNGMV